MRTNEFVKKFGWKVAKSVLLDIPVGDAELYSNFCYLKNAHSEGDIDHFSLYSNCSNGWVESSRESKDFIDESIALDDLKRLVESWELVESCGGLINSRKLMGEKKDEEFVKYMDFLGCSYPRFLQAIADVESCQ